jgi:hypothetical protein
VGIPGVGGGGLATGSARGQIGGILATALKFALPVAVGVAIAQGLREVALKLNPESDARKAAFEAQQGGLFGFLAGNKGALPVKVVNAGTPQGQFNAANQGGVPVNVKKMPEYLFDHIGKQIKQQEKAVTAALKEGDIHAARMADRHITMLNTLRGTVRQGTNLIIPKLGQVNRALSVANRNLSEGNRRQREIAAGVNAARERISTGFQASNAQLGIIARKPTQFTANITTNVTATLSTYQALQSSSRIYSIHAGTPNSGFQPNTI